MLILTELQTFCYVLYIYGCVLAIQSTDSMIQCISCISYTSVIKMHVCRYLSISRLMHFFVMHTTLGWSSLKTVWCIFHICDIPSAIDKKHNCSTINMPGSYTVLLLGTLAVNFLPRNLPSHKQFSSWNRGAKTYWGGYQWLSTSSAS